MYQFEKMNKKLLGSQVEEELMNYILSEPVEIGKVIWIRKSSKSKKGLLLLYTSVLGECIGKLYISGEVRIAISNRKLIESIEVEGNKKHRSGSEIGSIEVLGK